MTPTILLIAGQAKAGTTSLFNWMSQHPNISSGNLKELRFFLDENYPLSSPGRFTGDNLCEYFEMFDKPLKEVLLDASPDYFSCDLPLQVPQIHKNAKAIIIIRDPVSRMVSAYRFFKARGRVPMSMSFDEYISKQEQEGVCEWTPVEYRSLDHCRVEYYLSKWRDAYKDNLLVLDFNELKRDPQNILNEVCKFAGISQIHFSLKDQFEVANKTVEVKSPLLYKIYCDARRVASTQLMNIKWAKRILSPFSRILNALLTAENQPETIEPSKNSLSIISRKVYE